MNQDELMKQDGYIRCTLAAELAGVHVTTIYGLVDNEEVKGATLGSKRYVHQKQIAEYYKESPTIHKRLLAA